MRIACASELLWRQNDRREHTGHRVDQYRLRAAPYSSFIDSPESERDLRVTWISLGPIRLGYDVLDPSKMYSALAGPSQGVSGQNQRSRHASR
jgi:hypothetical protein